MASKKLTPSYIKYPWKDKGELNMTSRGMPGNDFPNISSSQFVRRNLTGAFYYSNPLDTSFLKNIQNESSKEYEFFKDVITPSLKKIYPDSNITPEAFLQLYNIKKSLSPNQKKQLKALRKPTIITIDRISNDLARGLKKYPYTKPLLSTKGTPLYDWFNNEENITHIDTISKFNELDPKEVPKALNKVKDSLSKRFKKYPEEGRDEKYLKLQIDPLQRNHILQGKDQQTLFFTIKTQLPTNNLKENEGNELEYSTFISWPPTKTSPVLSKLKTYLSDERIVKNYVARVVEGGSNRVADDLRTNTFLVLSMIKTLNLPLDIIPYDDEETLTGLLYANRRNINGPYQLKKKLLPGGRSVPVGEFLQNLINQKTTLLDNPEDVPLLTLKSFKELSGDSSIKPEGTTISDLKDGILRAYDLYKNKKPGTLDFRMLVEGKFKSSIKDLKQRYFIDADVVDAINAGKNAVEMGKEIDPRYIQAMRKYFTVDTDNNTIVMRDRSKTPNLGLRYEHLIPVNVMQQLIGVYADMKFQILKITGNVEDAVGEDSQLMNEMEIEAKEILTRLYSIAYIDLDSSDDLDAGYKSTVPNFKEFIPEFDETTGKMKPYNIKGDVILARYNRASVEIKPLLVGPDSLFKGQDTVELEGYTNQQLEIEPGKRPSVQEHNTLKLVDLLNDLN